MEVYVCLIEALLAKNLVFSSFFVSKHCIWEAFLDVYSCFIM
uniref:Uncharacterized protein n=1 Tax=Rhizophora mucronata TaxID=61149 RepID=A0A2P2R258_RHIMU